MMLIVREVKEKSRIEIENEMETLQGSNDSLCELCGSPKWALSIHRPLRENFLPF